MQPTPQYREATQPVKLFEYLGAGLPVVVRLSSLVPVCQRHWRRNTG